MAHPMDVGLLKHFLEQLPDDMEVFIPDNMKNPSKSKLHPALCLTHDGDKIVISPINGGIDSWIVSCNTIEAFRKEEDDC